jgi:hypothetical protein
MAPSAKALIRLSRSHLHWGTRPLGKVSSLLVPRRRLELRHSISEKRQSALGHRGHPDQHDRRSISSKRPAGRHIARGGAALRRASSDPTSRPSALTSSPRYFLCDAGGGDPLKWAIAKLSDPAFMRLASAAISRTSSSCYVIRPWCSAPSCTSTVRGCSRALRGWPIVLVRFSLAALGQRVRPSGVHALSHATLSSYVVAVKQTQVEMPLRTPSAPARPGSSRRRQIGPRGSAPEGHRSSARGRGHPSPLGLA